MTGQRDIFTNPTAKDKPAGQPPDPHEATRPGSGVMSEAQWQAWMRDVADRMRRWNGNVDAMNNTPASEQAKQFITSGEDGS